ncbi:MAG TPA: hypothetical protein VGF06_02055 [Terriglobales bacterium]|jgi:hypothetical protein
MWTLANPRLQAVIICVLISIVYVFLWPGRKDPDRIRQRPLWRRIVLRWFHSITWLLIALAVILWSKVVAGIAAAVYIIFIVVSNQERTAGRPPHTSSG